MIQRISPTIKLVSITQPLIKGVETAEDFIAYTARVSNPANQMNMETAPKLLKYLMKNNHWSPFEMVSITMEIETTRDIARQILRHRSFSFQEFSQRYADASQLGFDKRECRLQDTKNRQNSISPDYENDLEAQAVNLQWNKIQDDLIKQTEHSYKWALDNGIAKEQARAILPEGLTLSRLYMSGTLRSWIHYCQLRCGNGTQLEHRRVALAVRSMIHKKFPSLEIEIG